VDTGARGGPALREALQPGEGVVQVCHTRPLNGNRWGVMPERGCKETLAGSMTAQGRCSPFWGTRWTQGGGERILSVYPCSF
jgi:hypothetical protein